MSRIGTTTCTNCGVRMDSVSCVEIAEIHEKGLKPQGKYGINEKKLPEPGDATVCIFCGHVMAFDETLQLRELTIAEQIALAGNPAMLIIQRARGDTMREHGADYFEKLKKSRK